MEASSGRSRLRPVVVDFLATLFVTFCIGVGTAVVLAACVVLMASEARGAPGQGLAPMKASEAKQGTLLFRDASGETLCAPLVSTEVTIRVSGPVARAQVKQTFRNPSDGWYEGVYVFPLPESSAVDRLRMTIGERVVEGVIRERGAAREDYAQAKRSGQRAALLEQERPNLFTSSVANVGPREDIVVEIEYQQTLRYDSGRFSLRFPMTVGVRYIPGAPLAGSTGSGWAADTTRVSDAARITPPVIHPSEGPANPVSIRVELDAGGPLARIDSPYHRISLHGDGPRGNVVELEGSVTPANRDFELAWTPAPGPEPRAAWFTEKHGEKTYGLLMLMPPQASGETRRVPREAVYVIDTSGSMSGTSIAQAKEALLLAIDGLSPGDRFNIIEFNSYARPLFKSGARPATPEHRAEARGWVRGLRAQGGTEMALALNLALNGGESGERVRQVVFLTDGQVGNEDELFRLVRSRLGDSRLFTVGIGSAPNSHFMTKAASLGRGTYTYIGKIEEVREKMAALFAKLESPVLKGVRIDWPEGAGAETWPSRIPDLYAGEPVVVTAALDRAEGQARVSALRGATPWEETFLLDQPARGSGLGVLWARDKVGSLEDALREGASAEETQAKIIELALTHHLVTKYTSLVAIERSPARPAHADLKTAAVPVNLPEGWSYDAVFGPQQADFALAGRLPQGATDSRFNLLAGALALLFATLLFRRSGFLRRREPGAAAAP